MKGGNAIEAIGSEMTRREMIGGAVGGAICALLPGVSSDATQLVAAEFPAEFIPENDYPYFGYVPDGIAAR